MSEAGFSIRANVVDIHARRVFPGVVEVAGGRILAVKDDTSRTRPETFLLPGFIDAHVHVESSLLVPREFARVAGARGTVAAVADPHEVANVLGVEGVRFMVDDGREASVRFAWGVPSCVPATSLETSGARLGPEEVAELLDRPEMTHLAEMMDLPGALARTPDVIAKIEAARARRSRDPRPRTHPPPTRDRPLLPRTASPPARFAKKTSACVPSSADASR